MRNLIITTASSKEILETRNYFKNLQKQEISWQNSRSEGLGISFLGGLWKMERICQITNLIANSQLLKPFSGRKIYEIYDGAFCKNI